MNEKSYSFNFIDKNVNVLYQNLVTQAFDQYGFEVYYIKATDYNPTTDLDTIFNEVQNRAYSYIYKLRMYSEEPTMMQGAGDIFSKFGLEIQDEITLYVTRKEFYNRMTNGEDQDYSEGSYSTLVNTEDDIRPKISDLIYVPFWKSIFEISFTEDKENMFLGFFSWKLICKKYNHDVSEKIDIEETGTTNQDIIDILRNDFNTEDDKREVEMDPTSPSFTPSTTEIHNDDIQEKAEDNKSDDGDFFNKW